MSSGTTVLGLAPCHDFISWAAERDLERMGPRVRELLKCIYREVSGGVVVGGEGSYLVASGLCEVNSFCSLRGASSG